MDALKQILDLFNIPEDMRWTWGEGGTEKALEKSWTDIVDSHEVTGLRLDGSTDSSIGHAHINIV